MNVEEKRERLNSEGVRAKIEMDYVTVRQSISILLLRLIVLEVLAAVGIIVAYLVVINILNDINFMLFEIPIFLLLVLLKIGLTVFIVLQWIDEYYKISTEEIIHKRGLIFKQEETNKLIHLTSLEVEQGLWGRIFNYGTIKMYNWSTEKTILLYLIHNPKRYAGILRKRIPNVDEDRKVLREHFIEED